MQTPRRTVGRELRKLNNLISREVSASTKTLEDRADHNVTEMHLNIVEYLVEAGPEGVMQRDIEEAFTVRKSTASRILKLMEKNGIIERHGVDYDARLKKIVLTEAAAQHQRQMRGKVKRMEERLTAGISEEELEQFFAVLEKMQRNIEGAHRALNSGSAHRDLEDRN